jgi:hypothetical protein
MKEQYMNNKHLYMECFIEMDVVIIMAGFWIIKINNY